MKLDLAGPSGWTRSLLVAYMTCECCTAATTTSASETHGGATPSTSRPMLLWCRDDVTNESNENITASPLHVFRIRSLLYIYNHDSFVNVLIVFQLRSTSSELHASEFVRDMGGVIIKSVFGYRRPQQECSRWH